MKWLLPHRFKSWGFILAPAGFLVWLTSQGGLWTAWMPPGEIGPAFQTRISIILTTSFFTFLFGLYCISFSREKREDEMVQRTRVDSFQFAALIQFLTFTISSLFMFFFGEPREAGMMLFLIGLIFVFWVSYIVRFNYIIHVRLRS
jgi:ABC-type spermidine/putrescine transport system permease subunit I